MKIVYLTDDYPPHTTGGAARVVYSLAKKMKELGHEVCVITTVRNRSEEGISSENGIFIYRLVSKYHERWRAWLGIYNFKVVGRIAAILRDIRPDVVHAHNIHYHLSYHALKQARNFAQKVFFTAHDVMSFAYTKFWPRENDCNLINYKMTFWQNLKIAKKRFNPFRNILIKKYLGYCDKIFAVSGALAEALRQNGIKNAVTIYNGFDAVNIFLPNPEELSGFKTRHNLNGKKVMLLAGRVSHEKGAYLMIEILPEIKKIVPEAVLFFAGVKEEEAVKFADYAKKFGVESCLRLSGWLDEGGMSMAYLSSDMVLAPSLIFDSFPTTNLEAALYKKPVIATCFGGSKEFIIDGKTGFVVNPYDKNALASKIIDLLSDKNKADSFGQAAFERLKNDFSLSRQAQILLQYYKQ